MVVSFLNFNSIVLGSEMTRVSHVEVAVGTEDSLREMLSFYGALGCKTIATDSSTEATLHLFGNGTSDGWSLRVFVSPSAASTASTEKTSATFQVFSVESLEVCTLRLGLWYQESRLTPKCNTVDPRTPGKTQADIVATVF
jgi:hypothetical protein